MTDNDKSGKFGNIKLGKCDAVAHLEQLNKALPNAVGVMVFIIEDVDDKIKIHAYTHGHVLPEHFKDVIDYSVIRIMQSVPVAVLPIPIHNIESGQEMS